MKSNDLLSILAPESVAIVGASNNPVKPGGRAIGYMRAHDFTGNIFPINPNRSIVQGLEAYPTLEALPKSPDVVVISVPGAEVATAVDEALAVGAKAALIYSSGFAELGAEGRLAQQRIAKQARAGGLRLLGPNTQGFANFRTGAVLNFSTMINEYPGVDGPVAVISQSGAGAAILYGALRRMGIGVRYLVATGNEADLQAADLAGAIAADAGIKLILLYIESIGDAASLAAAAAIAHQNDIPILAAKAGRSSVGQQTAASHTGAMASEDALVDAFLHQHGILRLADFDELADYAQIFLSGARPKGRDVVAISNSGATCVLVADGADEYGLTLANLNERAINALRKVLPSYVTARNPVDMTTALLGAPDIFRASLESIGVHQRPDGLFVGFPVGGQGYDFESFSSATAAFTAATGVPVAVGATQEWVARHFRDKGVPVYASERRAMRALALLSAYVERHAEIAERNTGAVRLLHSKPTANAGSGFSCDEVESLAFLAACGLPVVEHTVCATELDVRAAFGRLGAPVVVKGVSRAVTHKSEHGLVRLNVTTENDALDAFRRMKVSLASQSPQKGSVLIARQHRADFELAIGAHVDPVFGPVVMVGHGGVLIEALQDVQFLLPPFSKAEALVAIRLLRVARLMGAIRGMTPVDLAPIAEMLVRLGDSMVNQERPILSADANPVIVGRGDVEPVVVDAVVVRAGDAGELR